MNFITFQKGFPSITHQKVSDNEESKKFKKWSKKLPEIIDLNLTIDPKNKVTSLCIEKNKRLTIKTCSKTYLKDLSNLWKFRGIFDGKLKKIGNCITTFDLSDNSLSYLSYRAFEGCNKVDELDLSENNFLTVPVNSFNSFNSLTQLDLSNNRLKKIKKGTFKKLPLLERLLLSFNELKEFESEAFHSSARLTDLEIDNNKLFELDEKVFNGLNKLKILNISCNSLITIKKDTFKDIPLNDLYMSNNKFIINMLFISAIEQLPNECRIYNNLKNEEAYHTTKELCTDLSNSIPSTDQVVPF